MQNDTEVECWKINSFSLLEKLNCHYQLQWNGPVFLLWWHVGDLHLVSSDKGSLLAITRLHYEGLQTVGWGEGPCALVTPAVGVCFFLQNNLFAFKNGTQITTKTNHYILLTNVSIKRWIIPSSNRVLLGGGGKSSSQTSTLQTRTSVIQVMRTIN